MTDQNYYCKHCKKLRENETCPNCSNKPVRISERTKCSEQKSKDKLLSYSDNMTCETCENGPIS